MPLRDFAMRAICSEGLKVSRSSFSAPSLAFPCLALASLFLAGCGEEKPVVERASFEIKTVTFNKPNILYVGESTEIQAILDTKALSDLEKNDLFRGLPGERAERTVRVHKYLSAYLKADPQMLSITPKDDKLRRTDENEKLYWSWYIVPLRVGNIRISFDIFSQDNPAAGSPVSEALVMHETWTAQARGFELIKYYVSEIQPIYAALAAAGTGMAGLIGFFLHRKAEKNKKTD
ncbi:hypothetical protein B1812_06125 [Methylocystis bryophila]|uniref:Uncharacterized protein n=1 Tax=Methylocystis bryophila TaxID=655015 RepID=A0A1W6MTA0_9HYPH|nr:hypothetical protein B1812_06125 [Methylocystis bryophila]